MLPILYGFLITLAAHIIARLLGKKFSQVPVVITSVVIVLILLFVFNWQYNDYFDQIHSWFDRLLGYVTVALAIPLAAIKFDGFPIKKLMKLLLLATLIGALLPMSLAWLMQLSQDSILAFATRAVTTPIGLSISTVIGSPPTLATLIIIVSGIIGGAISPLLFKNIEDDRAKGLALGLVAHAIGTAEAWQISDTAGRYAAFGMAVNGMITAVWLPIAFVLI